MLNIHIGGTMKTENRSVKRTKKMIRLAFIELLGEKKSFENITVSDICDRANICRSTFYYHYDDVYFVAEEFENELIEKLTLYFVEIEEQTAKEYELCIKKVIEFLKENEEIYRKAIVSSDVKYFVEKLKLIMSKKVFEESTSLPFSTNEKEKYAQIRFLSNACVDIMVDYFKGNIKLTLDEVGDLIINFLNNLKE